MNHKDLLTIEFLARQYDEGNIPLYLSYPTTSWWKSRADETDFVTAFQKDAHPLLYFHFPFCKKACYYCACYNHVTRDEAEKQTYLNYLTKEFHTKLDRLDVTKVSPASHMHWGGGTPTYMSCHQIETFYKTILSRVNLITGPDAGISIEAYPDDTMLTRSKLQLLRELGFNEISFGVQDFDPRVQKTINRNVTRHCTANLIETCKTLGFRVHIDLCYGLPFQGLNELEQTARAVIDMDPDRIALFSYAHYPMQFPLQKRIPASSIPNSFIRVLMANTFEALFKSENYCQVGLDHFVKHGDPLYRAWEKGRIVRNFMGYATAERTKHIGFGNAAISFIGNRFFHNKTSLKAYYAAIDHHLFPTEATMGHALSEDDCLRNKLIQQAILCDLQIDKQAISREFAIDFDTYFKPELTNLSAYENDGLINTHQDGKITITDQGRYFAKHIAHVFDTYYH